MVEGFALKRSYSVSSLPDSYHYWNRRICHLWNSPFWVLF